MLFKRIKRKLNRIFKLNKENDLIFTKNYFVGKAYIIGDYTYGHPKVLYDNGGANLEIGKYCSIAEGVSIFLGGNHRQDWITTYPFPWLPQYFPELSHIKNHTSTKGSVIIENDVWIGQNASVLSGVTIENGAVIAASSVVTKNIGPYEIWGGNPAKFIKKRFTDEVIAELQEIKWWENDLDSIMKNGEILMSSDIHKLEKLKKNKF
jgi:acetyltransferase-like isoleucine patch superfamily enzyme